MIGRRLMWHELGVIYLFSPRMKLGDEGFNNSYLHQRHNVKVRNGRKGWWRNRWVSLPISLAVSSSLNIFCLCMPKPDIAFLSQLQQRFFQRILEGAKWWGRSNGLNCCCSSCWGLKIWQRNLTLTATGESEKAWVTPGLTLYKFLWNHDSTLGYQKITRQGS